AAVVGIRSRSPGGELPVAVAAAVWLGLADPAGGDRPAGTHRGQPGVLHHPAALAADAAAALGRGGGSDVIRGLEIASLLVVLVISAYVLVAASGWQLQAKLFPWVVGFPLL